MVVEKTLFDGCFIIEPTVFDDSRGCFFESFNSKKFKTLVGIDIDFVQDNISISHYKSIRGLHIQRPPFCQAKLVQVLKGKVMDVVVDVRDKSPTFGKKIKIELSEENKKQLFIPRGFLHGFVSLTPQVIFFYKSDNFYSKESEDGVNVLDESLNIDWGIDRDDFIISDKDKSLKSFEKFNPILL